MTILNQQCDTIDLEVVSLEGELIVARIQVDESQKLLDQKDFEASVKNQLSQIIAKMLIRNKLVYFSKSEDYYSMTTNYMARVGIVPIDKVQILAKTVNNNPMVRRVSK